MFFEVMTSQLKLLFIPPSNMHISVKTCENSYKQFEFAVSLWPEHSLRLVTWPTSKYF